MSTWSRSKGLAMADAGTKTVDVEYFAQLREQAGIGRESVRTRVDTVAALYAERRACHGFTLLPSQLKVAVNAAFVDWGSEIRDGDVIVFVPPVAGG